MHPSILREFTLSNLNSSFISSVNIKKLSNEFILIEFKLKKENVLCRQLNNYSYYFSFDGIEEISEYKELKEFFETEYSLSEIGYKIAVTEDKNYITFVYIPLQYIVPDNFILLE